MGHLRRLSLQAWLWSRHGFWHAGPDLALPYIRLFWMILGTNIKVEALLKIFEVLFIDIVQWTAEYKHFWLGRHFVCASANLQGEDCGFEDDSTLCLTKLLRYKCTCSLKNCSNVFCEVARLLRRHDARSQAQRRWSWDNVSLLLPDLVFEICADTEA